jgi:hypothetical protein
MKEGDKLIAINECIMDCSETKTLTIGKEYKVIEVNDEEFSIIDDENDRHYFCLDSYKDIFNQKKDIHYDNTNGSLYLFASQHELNAYEFDVIKRIVRCRKKGQFRDDLEKSIRVIELYLKETE